MHPEVRLLDHMIVLFNFLRKLHIVFQVVCQFIFQPEVHRFFLNHIFHDYLSLAFFFFGLFRATLIAYESSQARGRTGAAAAGLPHKYSKKDPSHVCDLQHSSWQCRILNALSEARDRTCVLWILVRFLTAKPQLKLPFLVFLILVIPASMQ